MPNESKSWQKDWWDKALIIAQIIAYVFIPLMIFMFNLVVWIKGNKLAESNHELARAQVKVSLMPSLSSRDPMQRSIALDILKSVDEEYASIIAIAFANDPDKDVHDRARVILGSLSKSKTEKVAQIAKKGADQYDLMSELRRKELLKKLTDARRYIEGGAEGWTQEALKLYHEVINELSLQALRNIDQGLLRDAQNDEKDGHTEHAVRKYRALFQDYGG